jgi:hypothetical protein
VKSDDVQALTAMAETVLRLSSVAWAGARTSSRGMMLHRDAAVVRFGASEGQAVVQVRDGQVVQRVVLGAASDDVTSNCTCTDGQPCAHAVAALIELQRRVRQARQSSEQLTAVMSTLRSRLDGARSETPQANRTKMLDSIDRLPLPAGVDMVALTWRQGLRQGPLEVKELQGIAARVEEVAVADPPTARALSLKLLGALAATKVVFVPLPEAAEHVVIRLVPVAIGVGTDQVPPEETVQVLVDMALDARPQVAAHVAAGLDIACLRSAGLFAAVSAQALEGLHRGRIEWREVAMPSGRDRLLSALASAAVHHGSLDRATDLARSWPPMRRELQVVMAALGRAGQGEEAMAIADFYDPRGESWTAGVGAAAEAALDAGQRDTAHRLAARAFEQQPSQPWFDLLSRTASPRVWRERRPLLVARLLAEGDPAWLADRLAGEPDAVDALLHAIMTGPLADRTVRAALQHLTELDPMAAFLGRAARLAALTTSPGTSVRQFQNEISALCDSAGGLGEPGLAVDLGKLLARERGDCAPLVKAMHGVLGR